MHSSSDNEQEDVSSTTASAEVNSEIPANASKNYFFDRTLKENMGKPLHKEFSIEGFAIYIESGPQTRMVCFSDSEEHNAIE